MAVKRMIQFVSVLSVCLLALSLVCTPAHATPVCIYYVAKGGWTSQDGTSWGTAYHDLQPAMDKAGYDGQFSQYPCQVWVAEGEYKPANPGGVFYLRNYTDVYGGFEGDETPQTPLNQRDWRGHPTILTGNNSPHIIYADSPYDAALNGFTIQGGGTMNQPAPDYGGGIDLNWG